jgi:radical SAM superfamily enzyme YgiQ (UPF0313 family)
LLQWNPKVEVKMSEHNKKVALIAYYDRICLSIRALSSALKNKGHIPYLIYFKDDRTVIKENIDEKSKYYQTINNNKFIGCGEDVNPPTQTEINLLLDKIKEINPDLIGISARTVGKEISKQIVTKLRKTLTNVFYIAGGWGPTLEPEEFLEFLDFVCLGEGDTAICDLLEAEDHKKVNNIAWMEKGKLRYNALSKGLPVDGLDYPDWDFQNKYMIEDNKITPHQYVYDTETYDIYASRGCPSTCTYCMACQWSRIYKKYGYSIPKVRLRSVESVIKELEYAKENYHIKYVRFMDSIFGYKKEWLLKFLDEYDKKIGKKFFCYLDERYIDEERIKRLKDSGFHFTTVGIQSANEKIRKEIMGRKISDDGIVRYAECLKKYGIRIKYDIIGWNPFETSESLGEGITFLKRLPKGERTVVFQIKIFPGSEIHELKEKIKPEMLTNEEFEYWAWIYQMILLSKESEEAADFILKFNAFKDNPRILQKILDEIIHRDQYQDKIIAARKIRKGEILTNVMIDQIKTDRKGGIFYDDKMKIIAKVACKEILEGHMVQWDDFFGTYQNVGKGEF